MSVVESKREEGELRALTKARELAVYTIRICCNENNFPKRYRWCITNKVVDRYYKSLWEENVYETCNS